METSRNNNPNPGGTRIDRMVALLPINFFILAVLFFAAGDAAMPWMVRYFAAGDFYGPLQLAFVHTFTIGWITASIMGVMYRYVPALTRSRLPLPRTAVAQFVLFVIGSTGMVAHFAIGVWLGTWLVAIVLVVSVMMFAANMLPLLWPHIGRGVAETGLFGAVCFLFAAAVLGLLLGMDKTYGFMGGSMLTNLAGHIVLAAVGWVTLAICAVSYRMLPAFILPRIPLPRYAIYQLYALGVSVVGLGATLLARWDGAPLWSAMVVLTLLAYLATMARLMRARRMPLDWTARHALAGFVWMVAAAAAGAVLSRTGISSLLSARVAAVFGAAAFLGFFSNLIIGMSYPLFAGFVVRARSVAGRKAVKAERITVMRPRLAIFILFNAGTAIVAAGLLTGVQTIAAAGSTLAAIGAIIFAATALRTLSFAYRAKAPVARTALDAAGSGS